MNQRLFYAMVIAPLLAISLSVQATPGSRSDETPWFGFGSIVNRILDIQSDIVSTQNHMVEELRSLNASYLSERHALEEDKDNASLFGFPMITDSRSDYDEEIRSLEAERTAETKAVRNEYQNELNALAKAIHSALASPPDDKGRARTNRIKVGTASREAMELYNAAENLKASIQELNARLAAERSNYALAATSYRAQIQLARYVIEMNQQFKARIHAVYRPDFQSALVRVERGRVRVQEAESLDAELKARETEKLDRLKQAVKAALPKLASHARWASQNIASLQENMETLNVLKENVEIARDVSGMVAKINAERISVDVTMPELIEYELQSSDLEVSQAQ